MATAWKRHETTDVLVMHAHNRESSVTEAKLQALRNLNIPYSSYHYQQSDRSFTKVWYAPAALVNEKYKAEIARILEEENSVYRGGF